MALWCKRQLKVSDLVLICEKTAIKGKYRLAIVTDVSVSKDGLVRKAELTYHVPGPGKVEVDSKGDYQWKGGRKGKLKGKAIVVTRSIQRLSLILGVEEQSDPIEVIEHHGHVSVVPADEEGVSPAKH